MTNEKDWVSYKPTGRLEDFPMREMSDAEITAAAHSDPDTVMIDDHFINTHAMFFSPDGQRRFIVVPENSMLEVDGQNRLLGFLPRLPVMPPPVDRG